MGLTNVTRPTHTCDRETADTNQDEAAVVLTVDMLVRYKTLPSATRVIEMKRMLTAVVDRLAEQGGATDEELRLITEALVHHVMECKEAKAKAAKLEARRAALPL